MATTGFWPVKGKLKDVLDYADNPDKTTDKKFLDEDLWNVLRYTENDQKTDQQMYVSGINCAPQRAYEAMMDTKEELKNQAKDITKKMQPLRKQRQLTIDILVKSIPRMEELLEYERKIEERTLQRIRTQGRGR